MAYENDEFLKPLRSAFLDDAAFLLEWCGESYLHLEDPHQRVEELSRIFRLSQALKGAGAALGFSELSGFAHLVGECLSLLRARPDLVDSQIISLLLRANEAFKERVGSLRTKNGAPWNVDSLRQEFQELTESIQLRSGLTGTLMMPATQAGGAQACVETAGENWSDLAHRVREELNLSGQAVATAARKKEASPEPELQKGGVRSSAGPLAGASVAAPTPTRAQAKAPGQASDAASAASGASIKIEADRVDAVLNIVGELVVVKSQLMNRCERYAGDLRLDSVVGLMDKIVRELQDKTISMRMTPLRPIFLKSQRIVRDLSVSFGKPVDFLMSGEDTEIDRTMVDLLMDPLMHMVRNAVDHGIERPELRKQKGKPERGQIHLSAQQVGGRILLKIRDDGGGIPRAKILAKAREKGLISPERDPSTLAEKEIFSFIFAPGFSTAERVTDVSGRGVGMDVVKTNIEKLKGTIEIESQEGEGTCVAVSIPLTASITDGMMVERSGATYVLPMECIRELVNLEDASCIRTSPEAQVLNHRGRILPLISLSKKLRSEYASREGEGAGERMVVLVEAGGSQFAIRVDRVIGQTQVVLKPVGNGFKQVRGVAGAAILGDGRVALVLDPVGLTEEKAAA